MTPVALADLMYDADYNPAIRAALPVAVRAALDHGDAALLLRLLRVSDSYALRSPPREFSAARYATVCEDTPLPWPRGTPLDQRLAVARARALALPPAAFHPFDAQVAYADEIDLCLRWPDSPRPPAPAGGAYPAVPTLLLQGEEDLRTPPETSARVATQIPGAQRVTVPGVGHAIVGADVSGCGVRQLLRFVAARPVRSRCPRVATDVPATAVPPTRVRAARAGARAARRAPAARSPRSTRRSTSSTSPARPPSTRCGAAAGCAAGTTGSGPTRGCTASWSCPASAWTGAAPATARCACGSAARAPPTAGSP